ncbi:sarcosine oxidase subunit gamma [Roseovarius aestuariivivens]|uniref:sarcosine oxidase subunit gamma n=1 Tax=Roseovarius aestuariivivens TaxID=1888910 RepID=UPI0010807C2F|nr:sarcosine oxidase subunit gamma family protein [Roseovarius aestuariivivens]
MAEFTLTAAPPLAGHDETFGDTRLHAPQDFAIVSVALPLGGETAAKKAIKTAYGVELPAPGKSVVAKGKERILRLAPDLAFVFFTHAGADAETIVADKLKDKAYLTDQTDVWTALELSGPMARAALERICPLDLYTDAFALNDGARTVMEHLGTIILRTDDDTYLLLSASSSADSFLHAIETSIKNVI